MMAYISRLHLIRKAVLSNKYQVIITERSVMTDRHIFARMLHEDGHISLDEMTIYLSWFDEFLSEVYPSSFVYVRASSAICDGRIKKRARPGEIIDSDYLHRCHEFHEKWLGSMGDNVVVLDADLDLSLHPEIHMEWSKKIEEQFNYRSCKLYFDGACRGNPANKLGLGFVVYQKNTEVLHEFKKCVVECANAKKAIGKNYLGVASSEKNNLKYRRSLFLIKDLKKGKKFTKENISSIRGGKGLDPKFLSNFIGKISLKNLKGPRPLSFKMIKK